MSLKSIEEVLYNFKRQGDVKKADDSIKLYDYWLTTKDEKIKNDIIEYNKEDCKSTFYLREFLVKNKPETISWFSITPEAEKKSQTKTLAGILMNQKKFCGIGNYLKSEILYAAKLSPHRTLESLTSDDITTLFHQSKKIIQASYDNGGGSAGDFSDLNKKKGSYKFQFQVYGRTHDPLGNKVKKETTQDKRTTHWVPTVQS